MILNKIFSLTGILAIGIAISACSLLDATTDTTVQITQGFTHATSDISSSTTPDDSADAATNRVKKLQMFTQHNYMNLQQNVAQGKGEYLSSLETLLGVSSKQHERFSRFTQTNYEQIFGGKDRMTNNILIQMADFGSEEMRHALLSEESKS